MGRGADAPLAGALPRRGGLRGRRGDRGRDDRRPARGAGRPAAAGRVPRRAGGGGRARSTSRTSPPASPTSSSAGTRTSSAPTRHPTDLHATWEQRKAVEKGRTSALEGIPEQLSALSRAGKILSRARSRQVPLPAPAGVEPITDEALGEALLNLVRRAQASGLDAEQSARTAVRRLEQRVRDAERRLACWCERAHMTVRELRRDVEAALAARRDLGPDYDDAVAASWPTGRRAGRASGSPTSGSTSLRGPAARTRGRDGDRRRPVRPRDHLARRRHPDHRHRRTTRSS